MFCSIFVSFQMSDIWDESFVVLVLFFICAFFSFFSCFISNKFERVVRLPPICFCRSSSSSNFKTAELAKFKGFVFSSTSTLCYTTPHDDGMTKYKKIRKRNRTIVSVMWALYGFCVYCNCLNVCRLCWRWRWLIHCSVKILVLLARFCLVARAP